MIRTLPTRLLALALAALPAAAQFQRQHVDATLYTRAEGDVVQAALELEVDLGWYVYHADKGPGTGAPTVVELGGEGLAWSAPRWPEPARHEQPALGDQPATWTWTHAGTITLYATARADDAANAANAVARVTGQTCEDVPIGGTCVPFTLEGVTSAGAGDDAVWAGFPEDLVPAAADVIESGEADATLHVRVRDRRALAAITVEVADGWHLFHTELGGTKLALPLKIALAAEGVAWGAPALPAPERVEQPGGEWAWAHHGTFTIFVEGEVEQGATPGPASVVLTGQTCSEGDGGVCLPYRETAHDRGEGDDALFAGADDAFARPATSGDLPAAVEGKDTSLLAFLGLAVFWGLITLLMPCTYPMIPITISFFTKQAHARGGKVASLAALYGAGIVLIFIAIGVVIGGAIIPFATHWLTNLVIAGLFVLFALSLFGLINLEPPAAMMNLAGKASMTGGYLGVFLMGATLVITSFTCTAPFVGSLLSVGASDGDLGRIVIGMGAFGLTMAIPFVILSLVPGRIAAMPKSGQWMNTLKVALGFVELAAVFKFLSNADLVLGWKVVSRELFLAAWALIFGAAALYLLLFAGGKRAPLAGGRALAGYAFLGLAAYFAFGVSGRKLDPVMTAIAPNYSGGRLTPELWKTGARHTIVVDDYDAALERAIAERKLLLVNFTGFTCSNCRLMEETVFPDDEVAELLERGFVEARLHTDGHVNRERILELQKELAQSLANPFYVTQDPATQAVLGRLEGYYPAESFAAFLDEALAARPADGRSARR